MASKRKKLYRKYLQSAAWKKKRREIFARAQGLCEVCRETAARHVHHLSYANLGDEPLTDLLAVCVACHERAHPDKPGFGAKPKKKRKKKPKRPVWSEPSRKALAKKMAKRRRKQAHDHARRTKGGFWMWVERHKPSRA